jgi:rare lipoprotein A
MNKQANPSRALRFAGLGAVLALGLTAPIWPASAAAEQRATRPQPVRLSPAAKPEIDRSGRRRIGKASFYATMFAGRKMADGSPMEPTGNNAASRTLPLGTTARVTNLETGKTAIVMIRDRGPYVAGRIVDLSPATAHEIGLEPRLGVTRVAVSPITVPMPNGAIKLGDGVLEAQNRTDRDNRIDRRVPAGDGGDAGG